ncbi:hypothetical protein ACFYNO_23295 [Kitasatospora sp. NPDC006697]|uniref:hypothetical protein n=1 Tax=Kitasatospora sp. NPDC006697 TaxID=3364020 RepID=UPI003698247A
MADTGHGSAGSSAPGPLPRTVPGAVEQLAREHGLDELTGVRRSVSPVRAVAVGWGSALVALALTVVMCHEAAGTTLFTPAGAALHALSLAFLFVFAAGTAVGLRALRAGSRAVYLYDGGLVHTDRAGARAVPWSAIVGLWGIRRPPARGVPGRLLGYRLLTFDGISFVVPLIPVDGHDPFVARIVEAVRESDHPIL